MQLLKKSVSQISRSEREPKETQSPWSLNQALHDTASFDEFNSEPPEVVLSQDMEGMAERWIEQPVEQEVGSRRICWAKDERGRRKDGQAWKTGIKLQEEHKPHGQELILFKY